MPLSQCGEPEERQAIMTAVPEVTSGNMAWESKGYKAERRLEFTTDRGTTARIIQVGRVRRESWWCRYDPLDFSVGST